MALLKATPACSQFTFGRDLGKIDGRRAVSIVDALVVGFFRRHLKNEAVPVLDDLASAFPEVQRGDVAHLPGFIPAPRKSGPIARCATGRKTRRGAIGTGGATGLAVGSAAIGRPWLMLSRFDLPLFAAWRIGGPGARSCP